MSGATEEMQACCASTPLSCPDRRLPFRGFVRHLKERPYRIHLILKHLPGEGKMSRFLFLPVAAIIYVIFFATFLYLIGFVAGLPALPTNVDHGAEAAPLTAAAIDLALIALFGLQHSVMARPGFKAVWTRIVPKPIERSVYVLAASLVLIALFAFWCPIDGIVWQVDAPAARAVLWAVFGLGWLIVLLSTFLINHFELFGLSQVIRNLRNRTPGAPVLRTPFFYRFVRHPLYSGFFIAFWATPTMSYGHLLLAVGMSVYILIAIRHEERDLIDVFGSDYEDYRRRVGMLTPWVGRAK
jgi:protein-S-isoprenylcysteine O-methyltransferase Ste14